MGRAEGKSYKRLPRRACSNGGGEDRCRAARLRFSWRCDPCAASISPTATYRFGAAGPQACMPVRCWWRCEASLRPVAYVCAGEDEAWQQYARYVYGI